MKLTHAFFLVTGLVATAADLKATDVYNCANLGVNCYMTRSNTKSPFTCTCVENSAQPHLADFFSKQDFLGFLWQGHGEYGSCLNLPKFWDGNSVSLKSATDPRTTCCLYTDKNCNTEGYPSIQLGDGDVADVVYPFDLTRSFRCSVAVDGNSLCTDPVP